MTAGRRRCSTKVLQIHFHVEPAEERKSEVYRCLELFHLKQNGRLEVRFKGWRFEPNRPTLRSAHIPNEALVKNDDDKAVHAHRSNPQHSYLLSRRVLLIL